MKKCHKKGIDLSLLWASAILSSAILDAPQLLTLIILPVLAYMSVTLINKDHQS
ncbi:hypothetical protein KO495_11580 [Colwellia sp. D2M02]|uniref:hypothetical protein n=1 Tax=Colwellia sp. D2M02 TaxID=2841562 RepID=UPI001C096CA1|nr:hypothetical protein [Colwellia sp. D2M02]MBU2893957.1 hypothetical protein [Colwellia sp. D2M02]